MKQLNMNGKSLLAKGFTLVELVVVIVILGILAAVAVPQYVSLKSQARIASLNGLAGSIASAANLVQAQYQATGATASPITLQDGATQVAVSTGNNGGIPLSSAGGISNAIQTQGSFVYTAGPATGTFNFPTPVVNCLVTYTASTGAAATTTSGC